MTPLQSLAALVAFIAVFAYFVWGLGCGAYASLRAAHTSLRDHRERLRTDIEFAVERKVLNSIKRPRFALWLIKTFALAAVMIPVILVAIVLVVLGRRVGLDSSGGGTADRGASIGYYLAVVCHRVETPLMGQGIPAPPHVQAGPCSCPEDYCHGARWVGAKRRPIGKIIEAGRQIGTLGRRRIRRYCRRRNRNLGSQRSRSLGSRNHDSRRSRSHARSVGSRCQRSLCRRDGTWRD
jgi:hypothetical protein